MYSLNVASLQTMPEFLLASRIAVVRRGAGMAAVEAVELGADLVLRAFADRMAGQAFLERLLAGGHVLRLRGSRRQRHSASDGHRQNRFHGFALRCDASPPLAACAALPGSDMVLPALCVNRQMADIVAPDRNRESDRCRCGCRRRIGAVLARRERIVAALRAIVPGEGVIAAEREMRPLRVRRAHRLPPAADGGGAAGDHRAGRRRCCAIATTRASRWCRAAPAPRCRAARCRSPTACCSAWPSSTASARSISTTASRWSSPASPISRSATRSPHAGFYYAPDPSSQIACTIGGNVAENSGGVHCLKYGMTTNNVLGCEIVLMTGEVLRIGGKHLDAGGYDLLGIITGSEGLLGVVTEVTVRILKKPETARARAGRLPDARRTPANASRAIIGAGIIPGGMEMMDRPGDPRGGGIRPRRLSARRRGAADRRARRPAGRGRPPDRARRSDRQRMPRGVAARSRRSEEERLLFWAGRKAAFPAVGRISPDYYCMDGTIPRAKLPLVLARMKRDVGAIRPARRQRVPRRRRQPASAHPLRRQQAGRARHAPKHSAPTSSSSASRSAAC